MKNFTMRFLLLFSLAVGVSSCNKETNTNEEQDVAELSVAEKEMIDYMIEEEKLAYDVYVTLYNTHQLAIFSNISNSELSHMEAVRLLMEKYNVPNTASTTIGVFNNEHLQELYDALVAQGSQSVTDALTVGATIEDVDIYDLDAYLEETINPDIISVFDFLNCGSRNHLRGFVQQLSALEVSYVPQYITQDYFDQIIQSGHEICTSYTIN